LLCAIARSVHDDPTILTSRLSGLPGTFLHGDRKMGNLGSHPDGRTILLDWTLPGGGPACWDLCWYLALNRARLPEQKEAAIGRFRAALEGRGIATAAWWQEQLDLCLIGVMATFGWEKALGDAGELSWWEARVADAVTRQHIRFPGSADNRRSGHSEAVTGHGQGDAERVDQHDGGRAREPAAGQREQESQDEEPGLEDGEVVEGGKVLLRLPSARARGINRGRAAARGLGAVTVPGIGAGGVVLPDIRVDVRRYGCHRSIMSIR
jgi:hypothetical protein